MTTVATPPGVGVGVRLTDVVHLYRSPAGEVAALRGVDLDVAPGESVALLGPSGAGKSTVLALIAGEFPPSTGTVHVGSVDVGRAGPALLAGLRAKTISIVLQGADANLLPYATAADNVWFAQRGVVRRGHAAPWDPGELLARFGLEGVAGVPVERLSSGYRQRVALVTGAAGLPGLLLVDEPTSLLGPEDRDAVIETIGEIHRQIGMTVIVVTHDEAVAASLGRTVTIRDGKVGAEGRAGREFAVVGRDGSMHLPATALGLLPPGSLVEVVARRDGVELRRAENDGEAS